MSSLKNWLVLRLMIHRGYCFSTNLIYREYFYALVNRKAGCLIGDAMAIIHSWEHIPLALIEITAGY